MGYVRVYRVEHHVNKGGPFLDCGNMKLLNYAYREEYPTYHEEIDREPYFQSQVEDKGIPFPGCRFGTDSLDQLHHWFPTSIQNQLRKRGYVVRSYAVPEQDVVVLDKQVIFKGVR